MSETSRLLDSEWVRHSFILPPAKRKGDFGQRTDETRRREPVTAAFKYTDTTLGGNFAINTPAQFTPTADIRYQGLLGYHNEGMGRYYSDAIDDTRQVIHLSFGVPVFNSMTAFFKSFYDARTAMLANTGRSSILFYNIGLALGYVVSLPLQPFILGITAVRKVYQFINKQSPSKWYYFKPTMHTYWTAVNTIANDLAIHMGILPRVFSGDADRDLKPNNRNDAYDPAVWYEWMPDLFRKEGGVDVMALANRTTRMKVRADAIQEDMMRTASSADEVRATISAYMASHPGPGTKDGPGAKEYFYEAVDADGPATTGGGTSSFSDWGADAPDMFGAFMEFNKSALAAGNQFASFRVNNRGAMQESFTNSAREPDIAQTVNTRVNQVRSIRYSVMQGNVTGVIGEFLTSVGDIAAGVLDSVHLGGIGLLAGNAFLDVPKHWEGSTANLPRAEYTIPLFSPYGNRMSRYMNLMIPISMILAGGLPLSAGRSSYTSPFLCQIYHHGRVQCQLGMIDSITINRGTGNIGFNAENEMLGAEITVSVMDLSSIAHVPIKGSFSADNLPAAALSGIAATVGGALGGDTGAALGIAATTGAVWDEQSAFSDYMAVLGGLNPNDTWNFRNRLNTNMTRALQSFKDWKSPSRIYSYINDDSFTRLLMQFGQTGARF